MRVGTGAMEIGQSRQEMALTPGVAEPTENAPRAAIYMLAMLVLIYTLNFIDRTIIGSLAEPIKQDLGLADWQVGLMSGLAFSLFYSILGLPVARLAEQFSRVSIISIALAFWSLMTMICGVSQNFVQLLLARMGVGIGEAGCTPPAHSLIADCFPPARRATALGIYSLGIPLGALSGALAGGWIAHEFGWRLAFMIVGMPGVILAIVLRMTVREPARRHDAAGPAETAMPHLASVVAVLARDRRVRLVFASNALSSFTSFGLMVFAIPFLLRGTELNLFQAAAGYGLVFGLASLAGTGIGGWASDRISRRGRFDRLLLPGISFIVAAPLFVAATQVTALVTMALLVAAATLLRDLHVGPVLAAVQNAVGPQMRARASALLLLVMNLVGLGLGPVSIGWLSDRFAAATYGRLGDFAIDCVSNGHSATTQISAACRDASFAGIQAALASAALLYVLAGLCLLMASRHKDRAPDAQR